MNLVSLIKRRLRVIGNKVLGKIFGPKRDEKQEELHNLHLSLNIIK
jgi:hypothetical protein